MTPPRSPIFITPIQSDNTPVSPSEISKAVFAVSKVEFIMAGKNVEIAHEQEAKGGNDEGDEKKSNPNIIEYHGVKSVG